MYTLQNEVTEKEVSRKEVSPRECQRADARRNQSFLTPLGICAAAFALVLGTPASVDALEIGLLLTAPALINEVLLIVSLVAVFVALKVYQLVKGGLLAKSWQLFFIGLLCLALTQIITFSGNAGFFDAPELAQPILLLVMGVLWLYGAMKAKQALG